MLVAVAPTKYSKGIGREGSKADYEQVDLIDALTREYKSDAHLVGFVDLSRDDSKQHRWRKEDAACTLVDPSYLLFTTVFIDVDNPNHAKWTDEARAAAIQSYSMLPLPCGVYHTAHGARFVLPLAQPVPVLRAERIIYEVLSMFADAGVNVDWSVKDWTRHFRLPHVRRNGSFQRADYFDLSRMAPVDIVLPALPPVRDAAEPLPARRRQQPKPTIAWTSTLADRWQKLSLGISAAIRANVNAEYHKMYLAIGGALLMRGVPVEVVPELVRDIAARAGSSKPDHHAKSARDTVGKFVAGLSVSGMWKLSREYQQVADAITDALEDVFERPAPTQPKESLSETSQRLYDTILNAGDGLTVIKAECGLGKTHAAQKVAVQRAGKTHLRVVESKRAPAQSKTAISVDKNELAIQVANDIAAEGIPVRRVFGPLSVPDACIHADKAEHLVAGGQSLQWEFCLGRKRQKCEHYNFCTVKDGFIDTPSTDDTPRVTIGTHALIGALDAAAGASGLLVIDEPPPLLQTLAITQDELEVTLRRVYDFESNYAKEIAPLLLAVRDWEGGSFTELTSSIAADFSAYSRPPLRASAASMARSHLATAIEVGIASRTCLALMRATSAALVEVRLDEDTRTVIVTSTREDLSAALQRDGSVVAMDANADLHLAGFEKVVSYKPLMHTFAANDGATISRTHLRFGSSSRRAWFAHGRIVLDTGLVNAVRELVKWALDNGAQTLGVITMRVVELAILAALGQDVAKEWKAAGQRPGDLKTAIVELGEALEPLSGVTISTAHFGATRGLNKFAGVDALATLGDPWPSVPHVQTEAQFLGVDPNVRLEAIARAELEQAHGRLRVVHRKRPAHALHIGRVVPGGSAWETEAVVRRRIATGRPKAGATMTDRELERIVSMLGGPKLAAKEAGCSERTLRRYRNGDREVPPGVASTLRRATGVSVRSNPAENERTESPIKYSLGIGVSVRSDNDCDDPLLDKVGS